MATCTDRITKEKDESMTKPNWLELPIDLTMNILQRLDTVDILRSARNVCPLWRNIYKDPLKWRTILIRGLDHPFRIDRLGKICRCAIDLSCGHLEDIRIEHIGTDDLLEDMAHRVSHLQRLQLFKCDGVKDEGLAEFVKTLPLLEELDYVSRRGHISKECVEVIGRCCPLLKSLRLDTEGCCHSVCHGHGEAIFIGKTMPGLCHLKLFGIVLTNDELLTILDGCPLLESLHLSSLGVEGDILDIDFLSLVYLNFS
ncbi:F-box protein skip19 [Trifolium pratense]|uniref:F-box protein skip19 n=1 Tax=Trifolium pratense TaxID=57577 RepID=A0A2K3LFM7_TRIPR|nr:F-box protein skip19 [Trifolium pratense]